ncbi:hypothetical protein VTI74DRAFT_11619 [Chaetomium olivicolor]
MNTNIRKRRAYGQEDTLAEPVLNGLTYASSACLDTILLPADHQYILGQDPFVPLPSSDSSLPEIRQYTLEEAALILGQPYPPVLAHGNPAYPSPSDLSYTYLSSQAHQDLGHDHRIHKKPRLETSIPMPTPYSDGFSAQDGQEKSPLDDQPDAGRRSSGLSGWTAARLAECFFSMCPPCSTIEPQHVYQPLPPPPPYDYDGRRPPSLDTSKVSVQPQVQASLLPTPITPDPTSLLSCDEPALMTQYLSTYPPLQPTPVGGQPATGGEEMVYPTVSAAVQFDGKANGTHALSGPGMQGQPYLVGTPLQTPAIPGPYSAGGDLSPYGGSGIVMNLASRFHPMQRVDAGLGAENTCVQDESVVGFYPTHKTTPVKRGPFKDQDSREKTALTRKMGSCIRCRMQRIRCNLDPENEKGPCLSCRKIASGTRVYRLNCLRLKITDVKLYKPGQVQDKKWTDRWKDSVMDEIGNWESSRVRTIEVTEGFTGQSVRLAVRQFKPQEGDRTDRSWVSSNGKKRTVRIPCYAIVNLDDAKNAFNEYIKRGLPDCCNRLMASRDELLRRTYALAMKTAKDLATPPSERSLLEATLDLWMSVRLTTNSFEIVGDDTLDMPKDIINDRGNPLHGKIPLPPVMGAQIDSVIIHQIQPRLRRKALEELQKMTQEKKQKTWLTTYLVSFILLHNIALITKHDADYARKHGLKRRFAREANVKEYNLGANTLLAYFHYCNKAIYPFSAECKDTDLQTLAELSEDAIAFVHYTRRVVAEHKKEWEELWQQDDYENEFYYVSQLFEHGWQPRTMA